jgi:hypothetical protein
MTGWTPGAGERAIDAWLATHGCAHVRARPLTIRERIADWKLRRVARDLGLAIR